MRYHELFENQIGSKDVLESHGDEANMEQVMAETINSAALSSAVKVKNQLTKLYGFQFHRPLSGMGTAYLDWQSLDFSSDPEQANKLIADLKAAGWTTNNNNLIGKATKLINPVNKDVSITFHGNRKDGTVYGPKKAKISNLPYYD